ncbi:MAG: precorrin-6y C5,15-methyltransferase (decarboxylating) subunit CbiE [Actinomycetota bacterium]|nr:precorrin-6y C5,15-methyltransferase (decarboxylating) subunit CbiE [Actinomycetota bacterium]
MGRVITVVGMDERGLGPGAAKAVQDASLLVGAARHLAAVAPSPGTRTLTLGPVEPALDALRGHDGDAVVLASGDPGFFGIVRGMRAAGLKPVVEPAASSVATLAARVGVPWDDALVVSAHGRDPRRAVNVCRARPKVAVLTGPELGPGELARQLCGWHRLLVVGENLGLCDERVSEVSLGEAAARTWDPLSVVLAVRPDMPAEESPVWHAGAGPVPGAFALDDDAFEARGAMLTKAEVRAVALSRLGPRLGDLVWDVGAGSGSVAVEAARFGAAVVAVERDAEAVDLVRINAARHGVDVRAVHGVAPAGLAGLPDPDLVFVGGGGPGVVRACAARHPARIVVTLAAPERIGAVREALDGYRVGGTLVQAARLAALPDGTDRLAATNPVTVLWAER